MKKLLAVLLCASLCATLGLGAIGCTKKKTEEKTTKETKETTITKPVDPKPADMKSVDPKPADIKPVNPKPDITPPLPPPVPPVVNPPEAKPADPKPADSKPDLPKVPDAKFDGAALVPANPAQLAVLEKDDARSAFAVAEATPTPSLRS